MLIALEANIIESNAAILIRAVVHFPLCDLANEYGSGRHRFDAHRAGGGLYFNITSPGQVVASLFMDMDETASDFLRDDLPLLERVSHQSSPKPLSLPEEP